MQHPILIHLDTMVIELLLKKAWKGTNKCPFTTSPSTSTFRQVCWSCDPVCWGTGSVFTDRPLEGFGCQCNWCGAPRRHQVQKGSPMCWVPESVKCMLHSLEQMVFFIPRLNRLVPVMLGFRLGCDKYTFIVICFYSVRFDDLLQWASNSFKMTKWVEHPVLVLTTSKVISGRVPSSDSVDSRRL